MHLTGVRIYGANWTHFSHHYHDFSHYFELVEVYCREVRGNRAKQTADKLAASESTRVGLIKREDRPFKALEKASIFSSDLFHALENTVVGPCHHREVIGEDVRAMFKVLPFDHWLLTTVFKGLSYKKEKGRETLDDILTNKFSLNAADVAQIPRSKLEQHLVDQMFKYYVPMPKVSRFYNDMKLSLCVHYFVRTYLPL